MGNTRGFCGCLNEQTFNRLSWSRADELYARGDYKLGVAIALFKSQVTCIAPVSTPPKSCPYVVDETLKSVNDELFGGAADPSINLALRLTLRARKQNLEHRTSPCPILHY